MLVVGFGSGPLQANCYLLAEAAGGPCVVVDPGQEVAGPLAAALAGHRLVPAALVATHGHADHVSSAAELSAEHGVPLHLHAADAGLYDGDSVPLEPGTFAGLDIDVRHVPGHTPGSVVLGLRTAEGGGLALTGDTLFAGSVGRGADADVVRDLLTSLPDDTVVLPGHGPATTIGRERAGNPFLAGTGA
ncbi:Glyoxylase, beta-lactamase superfamily II [Amycolatopsis pretoriensis]|uniref:Glyoxylase, beta-lactamase superfamily II n=1 Tax=Amycolatopsis pretoriensis TaxID=218821 RepID=A0A1H5QB88_9PSEU|nr:MBL fold metallo-hydrolase [Amycolatopsis pretoriensis]SEF23382.1 Glyoxylase, beta-lactamase superfamily II [Amycolatopsis pretoriensis]